VADEKSLAQQLGVSPKKLALIGVLAAVLVGVMYVQFGGSGDGEMADQAASAQTARQSQRPRTARTSETQEGAKSNDQKDEWLLASVERRQWKTPALADVVRYDPFALPAAFPQPAVAGASGPTTSEGGVVVADGNTEEVQRAEAIAEIQAKLQELQQRGVRVIIQGRRQAAVIGDRTVHIGDDVDGFTVKAIKADGVVVERTLEQ
jgi:hypothetical protein